MHISRLFDRNSRYLIISIASIPFHNFRLPIYPCISYTRYRSFNDRVTDEGDIVKEVRYIATTVNFCYGSVSAYYNPPRR